MLANNLIFRMLVVRVKSQSSEYKDLSESVFIERIAKSFFVYRTISLVASVIILLAQQGSMASTIASCNNYVTKREQAYFANQSFTFYFMKSLASNVAYVVGLSLYYFKSDTSIWWNLVALFTLYIMFMLKMVQNSPLVYICYLGSALGKHVENFSTIYIDTMFDQFMKAIEMEDRGEQVNQVRSLPFFDSSESSSNTDGADSNDSASRWSGCYGCLCALKHHIARGLVALYNFVRVIAARLVMRKYPELPEMKMTKLSSTTNIQISETMRTANHHLIRVRLRRTQIMLSELRDLVSDINKTSSPILLMYIVFETISIILVTTGSIQCKVYKQLDVRILPTVSITIGLVVNVVYLCTCLDETAKQLKLLINKLFDFIIMNHRIQSTGKRVTNSKQQLHSNDSDVCLLSGSEDGAINETWSQFQYTRKLANTIQFRMGGILPVSRRLVLSILGHVLSAVFISIEIMHIIDTLNRPDGQHTDQNTNSTSTGNTNSLQHVSHHN